MEQLKPTVHETGPENQLLGVCPVMSVRQIFAIPSAPAPALHNGKIIDVPGPQQITLTPVDAVVYCQGSKCHFFRQDIKGCVVHLLANLITIADSGISAVSPPVREEFTPRAKKKAPPAPASEPGQADQVEK